MTTSCPFCKADNRCGYEKEKQGNNKHRLCKSQCWCMQLKIPQELLNLLPEEHKQPSCICQNCLENYHKAPAEFIKKYL